MDTTTNRQRALELLELDELSDQQRTTLNVAIAVLAGHRVIETPDGLRVRLAEVFGYDENGAGMHVFPLAPLRDYTTSIDACRTLPRPTGHEWRLYMGDRNTVSFGNWIASKEVCHDVPRAMLICWCMAQS